MNKSPRILESLFSFSKQKTREGLACCVFLEGEGDEDVLSVQEQVVYAQYVYPMRKKSYLQGRHCAKLAVSKLLNIDVFSSFSIGSGVFRQPIVRDLNNNGVMVSLAHSEEAALAVAFFDSYFCGVDLESMCPSKNDAVCSVLTSQEFGLLAQLDISISEGAFIFWCAKESLTKAMRTGLSLPFELLEIIRVEKINHSFKIFYKYFTQYSSLNWIQSGYCVSIATPKEVAPYGLISSFHLSAVSQAGTAVPRSDLSH